MTPTTEIAKTPETVVDLVKADDFKIKASMALPKHMTVEKFQRTCLTAFNKNPKLLECSQASVMQCLMTLSALGLEVDGRRAHLIPFGKECTLVLGYQGILELVKRSGDVQNVHADTVCENDEFEVNLGQIIHHRINYRKPRGATYAVYAIATLKDGTTQCCVMTMEEVEKVKACSKSSASGPWKDWPDEMAKKTVFKRLAKWLVWSAEYVNNALEADNSNYEDLPAAIPGPKYSSFLNSAQVHDAVEVAE